jgi:succinate-semialdehyde dehydrogenase/glutarate-semialdehyde dehydrogenase
MSPDIAISSERARLRLQRADLFRERAYVDGAWVDAASGSTLDVTNPATGGALGTIPTLSGADAMVAVAAAERALPEWRNRTAGERAVILERWRDLMLANLDDLARLMTAEQGKPLAEAQGEVAYAASFLKWFAEEARRINGAILPGHQRDKRILVLKQPIGVVAAITPWNFPSAMITRKVAPALAAGCTVVLKPSELTPFSALALAVLAEEAGVPPGVFNIITGNAADIGPVLTGDSRIRKLTFTGSTPVGKLLAAQCAPTMKRISMELGGNAPFIVFDDADLEGAVDGIMASKFRNTGQTCVCANRVLVQAGIHDRFVARLVERAAALRLGDGLDGPSDQGPLIDMRAITKVEAHIADALEKGASVALGGARAARGGSFFEPTVLTGATSDMVLAKAETFGPVAPIFKFETEEEAVALANDTSVGLAAYVFTSDLNRFFRVSEALEVGMVGINTGLISSELVPFGGIKESGIGREGSVYGIEEFLELKTLCVGGV